jgi:hypothetical protein
LTATRTLALNESSTRDARLAREPEAGDRRPNRTGAVCPSARSQGEPTQRNAATARGRHTLSDEERSRRPDCFAWHTEASRPIRTLDLSADRCSRPGLRRRYEPKETLMPLLIWLSACSYGHRVNAEMTRATLQFLDHVERRNCPQSKGYRAN